MAQLLTKCKNVVDNVVSWVVSRSVDGRVMAIFADEPMADLLLAHCDSTPHKAMIGMAIEVYNYINECDGAGLVVTDDDLLVKQLAGMFDVEPQEISDSYEDSDFESEDDDDDPE